jgi:hypothetical protein
LVEHYRAIEREAADVVEPRLRALQEAAGARGT